MTFVKASRHTREMPLFSLELARLNAARGVMTVIIPDTNVMIDMEDAAAEQVDDLEAILDGYQLRGLVDLLKSFEQERIPFSFSPYLAFQEMDSAFTKQSVRRYHQFGSKFGINWMDDPDLGRPDIKLGRPRLASWRSLGTDEQFFLSMSHATLMLMRPAVFKRVPDTRLTKSDVGCLTVSPRLPRGQLGMAVGGDGRLATRWMREQGLSGPESIDGHGVELVLVGVGALPEVEHNSSAECGAGGGP